MQRQTMFCLFGKINSMKVDSNLPASLIKRSVRCFKIELSEIKKAIPPWDFSVPLK